MTETAVSSDMGVGVALLFGVLGVGGALVMYVAAVSGSQVLSGWAFAGAMIAATILVAAVHLYD